MLENPELNLSSVLNWLISGGAVLVVAWFVSWQLESLAWWQALESRAKEGLILLFSLGIALIAQGAKGLPAEVVAAIEPYAQAAFMVVAVWLATQVAHKYRLTKTQGGAGYVGKQLDNNYVQNNTGYPAGEYPVSHPDY